ncbi:MAG: bifunctional DNA-formamidopyrimidine glycosylase/DNA-(apurinic or apyrimidinic site) lyase [Planctomycetota bacterium]
MPELPEVETVRRTLEARVVGRRVVNVWVERADVVRGDTAGLLRGERVERVTRRGKQLAMIGDVGGCLCVHLGMSGSLRLGKGDTGTEVPEPRGRAGEVPGRIPGGIPGGDHVHVVWGLEGGDEVRFRDPRRFGGVWMFGSEAELHERRWDKLGPDGLSITPGQLHAGLSRTRRALKAALLDQHLVAGLGNIYADELLFAVRIHPLRRADSVSPDEARRLVRTARRLLDRAIKAGGSTLRDYTDAYGQAGGFQTRHRVYGRAHQPCPRCRIPLDTLVVAGRTTTACPTCQG